MDRRDQVDRRLCLPLWRVVLAVLAHSFVHVDGGWLLAREIQPSEVGYVSLPDGVGDDPLASPGGRSRRRCESVWSQLSVCGIEK